MVDGRSVLVVSAQRSLRDSLTVLLTSLSLIERVQQAEDAASGLLIAETELPALVLLDASLPDGEAWSLLNRLRRRWPQIQCVVLTDTVQLRRQAEDAGAVHALLKGFPAAKLSVLLEQLIEQVVQA